MIRHYTIVTPNTPPDRAQIYGSAEEAQHFGASAVAASAPQPIAGGYWGPPVQSGNATPLCAWGVWATQGAAGALLAALPGVIASISGASFYTWDDSTETQVAYIARWQAAVGWTALQIGTTAIGAGSA